MTGACLAAAGHDVCIVDTDRGRAEQIGRGEVPFYEPGLSGQIAKAGPRLRATTEAAALGDRELVFLAVPTPSAADGACDTRTLFSAAESAIPHLADGAILAVKSTVPVGTTQRVAALAVAAGRDLRTAMNPEFLREGSAVADFLRPHRVVVGSADPSVFADFERLYAGVVDAERPLIPMDVRSAELCKYAANAQLAMRVAWLNELATLAHHLDANIDAIQHALGTDPRIGPDYLQPGPGYGGSCFPKDVRALGHQGRALGQPMHLVEATHAANQAHRERIVAQVLTALEGLPVPRLAIWGLAFKAESDDVRESIALQLLDALPPEVEAVSWDPQVGPAQLGLHAARVHRFATSPLDAAAGADLVVLLTEWPALAQVDLTQVATTMRGDRVIDARNLLVRSEVEAVGLRYSAVGR